MPEFRMDRTAFRINTFEEADNNTAYWLTRLLLFTLVLLSASGCDSEQFLRAFVIDAETQLPINSVSVHEINRNKTVLSDSVGFVDFYQIVGGANPPDLKMTFTKSGYEVFEMTFPPTTLDTLSIELSPE